MSQGWESLAAAGQVGPALSALAEIRKTRALRPEEVIGECELLDVSSSSDLSLDRATSLLRKRDLPTPLIARAWAVVGSQHFRMSRIAEGRSAFQKALGSAQQSGIATLHAQIRTGYLAWARRSESDPFAARKVIHMGA